MNVKNIVKVMNFHSLLRVDKARKEAEKYFAVEKELRRVIDVVTNNRNFMLDKRAMRINKAAPVLNIYVGSDLGFCAAYNFNVNDHMRKDAASQKIIIGKKVHANTASNVILTMTKDQYLENHDELKTLLTTGITEQKYSQINIMYNHYVNASVINWKAKRVFPLDATSMEDAEEQKEDYMEDFVCESDVTTLLVDMVAAYVGIEIELTVKNSLAAENIMRQNATSESLKKIDEIEEENKKVAYKIKTQKTSERVTESYTKQKYINGD